jgi:inosine-uridine nucleoside N-ribohydrolase
LLFVGLAAVHAAEASSAIKSQPSTAPTNVIFDTDIWGDIDDMLALAMLHALQDRGEAKLLAVTISTDDPWCAAYVDLVNTFYGHPDVPVGIVKHGITGAAAIKVTEDVVGQSIASAMQKITYPQWIAQRRNPDGSSIYTHRLVDGSKAPDAVSLLRKTLAAQPDGSVVIIQVGFSTNLARLLDSPPDANNSLTGSALVKKKVRLLSVMAGNFADTHSSGQVWPKGSPETNLLVDVPSAQQLFDRWPTPIVASGFEVGLAMLFPAVSIEHDFSYAENHPIAETYRYWSFGDMKWPHDHATFDLTSVLYAVRPDRDYFSLSKPGKIAVLPKGRSTFEERDGGMHRYLILTEEQKARALEAMVMLASQPPVHQ